MNKKLLAGMVAGTLSLFSPLPIMAKQKIAPDTPTKGPVQVIITYKADATDANHASVTSKGGSFKTKLQSVKGAVYTVDATALDSLAADPAVVSISPDRKVGNLLEFANPTVNANIARQYGFNGAGIGVAVIDSGVNDNK